MPISLDQNLCCGDSFCLKVCPTECFSIKEGKASLAKSAQLTCILCGQCVAICPTNAIEMNTIYPSINTKKDNVNSEIFSHKKACPIDVSKDQFLTLVQNRRSIRHFKKKSVPLNTLKEALEAARYAPTAKNMQAVEWTIVDGRENVEKVASLVMDFMRPNPLFKRLVKAHEKGLDPICRGASTLIFNHCLTDLPTKYGEVDCAIAVTHLDLFLPTIGLGSCWAGYIVGISKLYPPLKEFLKIPENQTIYTGLMLGFPTLKYQKLPQRKPISVHII